MAAVSITKPPSGDSKDKPSNSDDQLIVPQNNDLQLISIRAKVARLDALLSQNDNSSEPRHGNPPNSLSDNRLKRMHRIINEIDLFGLCKKTVLFFIVCYPDQNAGVPHRVRITMNWFLSQANGAEKPADNVNNEIWSTAQKEYLSDWQNALKDDNSFHKLTVFSLWAVIQGVPIDVAFSGDIDHENAEFAKVFRTNDATLCKLVSSTVKMFVS
jgi:hypothetical protein